MRVQERVAASIQQPMDESQVKGYIVVMGRGHMLQQAVGTPDGHLIHTEEGAQKLADQIMVHSGLDAVAIPVVIPSEF